MGLLGLMNLVYIAEKHTEEVRKIINANRDYPWAVGGINLTSMLITILGLSEGTIYKWFRILDLVRQNHLDTRWFEACVLPFYYCDNEDLFDILYCHSFLLLDKMWVKTKAQYMDFNSVMDKLKSKVSDVLVRKPVDVKQLIAWLDQAAHSI